MPLTARGADAILGVSLYSEAAPDAFGEFNRAFITMFRVAAGDTWVEGMPTVLEGGGLNQGFAAFLASYVFVVVWLVLQAECHRNRARLRLPRRAAPPPLPPL